MIGSFWTPARIKTLTALWALGETAAFIGLQINATRKAVIGKARRLGLPPHGSTGDDKRAKQPARPKIVRPKPAKPRLVAAPIERKPPLPPAEIIIVALNVGIMELEPGMCRYIAGDSRYPAIYCGAECADGKSYCPGHHRMVYTPRLALTESEKQPFWRAA